MRNYKKKLFFIIFISFIIFCFVKISSVNASGIQSFKESKLYANPQKIKNAVATKDKETLIKEIKNYIENEQYTEAMLELNKLLSKNTDDPRIYILSANLLRKTYQFDEAEKMGKKAIQLDYKDSDAYLALGYIFFDKAKFSVNNSDSKKTSENLEDYLTKSFDYFFMASQYDQANPLPHIALAEAYYANRQKEKAKDEILKAKELCFGKPDAYYEIGQYYYKIKKYNKARKYIEKSIDAGRNQNYRAYYLIGMISEQNGNIKEAQEEYLQTLKLKPDMIEAQKRLDALIKTSYKKMKAEESKPENLFADIDENLNLLMKADYYLMIDEFTKARDIYIKLLQRNPQNENAAAGLAELYYSMWKEGFQSSKNFTNDAIYIIKSKPSKKNEIALLKFQMINENKIPENVRQKLINLSISETYNFYDLLNEIRAEYLLGNYEECHNKLFRLMNMKLSNYEKFKVLKYLCYDHNYYEALIVLNELKKTYYHNEEIEPVESRINAKFRIVGKKLDKALNLWKKKNYSDSIAIYKEIMNYFPTYKPAYFYYALAMKSMENYDEAYDKLNTYYKLYKLYPDKNPEVKEAEIQELIKEIYTKEKEQIKEKAHS